MHCEKSLHLKKAKFIGGKQSKVTITGTAASNGLEDNIPMFVTGKSSNPCFFKGAKSKRSHYRAQKKSCMNSLKNEFANQIVNSNMKTEK